MQFLVRKIRVVLVLSFLYFLVLSLLAPAVISSEKKLFTSTETNSQVINQADTINKSNPTESSQNTIIRPTLTSLSTKFNQNDYVQIKTSFANVRGSLDDPGSACGTIGVRQAFAGNIAKIQQQNSVICGNLARWAVVFESGITGWVAQTDGLSTILELYEIKPSEVTIDNAVCAETRDDNWKVRFVNNGAINPFFSSSHCVDKIDLNLQNKVVGNGIGSDYYTAVFENELSLKNDVGTKYYLKISTDGGVKVKIGDQIVVDDMKNDGSKNIQTEPLYYGETYKGSDSTAGSNYLNTEITYTHFTGLSNIKVEILPFIEGTPPPPPDYDERIYTDHSQYFIGENINGFILASPYVDSGSRTFENSLSTSQGVFVKELPSSGEINFSVDQSGTFIMTSRINYPNLSKIVEVSKTFEIIEATESGKLSLDSEIIEATFAYHSLSGRIKIDAEITQDVYCGQRWSISKLSSVDDIHTFRINHDLPRKRSICTFGRKIINVSESNYVDKSLTNLKTKLILQINDAGV